MIDDIKNKHKQQAKSKKRHGVCEDVPYLGFFKLWSHIWDLLQQQKEEMKQQAESKKPIKDTEAQAKQEEARSARYVVCDRNRKK